MDTTEEYVLMCQEAHQVQAELTPTNKDFMVRPPGGSDEDMFILFRPDQLFGMIEEDGEGDENLTVQKQLQYVSSTVIKYKSLFSLEQAVLATVMRINYDLWWNTKNKKWEQIP